MGTKRPGCSVFDPLSNMTTADHKLHPGGKISRDPSPRPGTTPRSERDSNREEEWRRERETEKARHKVRYRDTDPRERYYERDGDPPPRPREGEREWRERERRRDDDRGRNGRPLSNLEKEAEKEIDKAMSKGGTFPRTRPGNEYHNRKPMFGPDEERYGTQRVGPRRTEADERERAWQREQRYRERERDDPRGKAKEDKKSRNREGYREPDAVFRDKRRDFQGGDSRDRRDRDAAWKKGERPRPDMGERRASPHRRRDRDADMREKEQTHRRGGGRDTRSEGDSDERELKREKMRDKEREETIYQHSRSEGDGKDASDRERHRDRRGPRDREGDGRRTGSADRRRGGQRDGERYDRRADRGGERWRDARDDRRCDRREHEQRKGRERKEQEADPRWADSTGLSSRSQREAAPRAPPRAQSSGEWSSDMDSETRYRRGRDSYEESGRDSEQERRSPEGGRREQKRSEKPHRGGMTGGAPEQRRMWLEPLRGKNSKESSLEEELVDRQRQTTYKDGRRDEERGMESGRRAKEEPDERYISERRTHRSSEGQTHDERREHREEQGRGERESEGVSAEGEKSGEVWRESDKGGKEHLSGSDEGTEGSWRRDAEGESTTDNTEESDREEQGGSDRWTRSESEGGSDTGWKQERGRMLSGEDGFVTVSSGGDEEEEREDEEEFVDCQDFWGGGNTGSAGAFKGRKVDEGRDGERAAGEEKSVDEDEEGREKQPKFVFCVIGQTLPRSKPSNTADKSEGDHLSLERHPDGDDITLKPQDDLNFSGNDEHLNDSGRDARAESERPVAGEPTKVERASSELHDAEMREEKEENPSAEIGSFQRDSQTERLLVQWREAIKEIPESERHSAVQHNPYADVCPQVNLDQILPELDIQAMSLEEKEAIQIRLSGAWSMSEEPKRHSQAPHLKWAKDVVREILGRSEENTVDDSEAEGGRQGGAAEAATEEVPPRKLDGQHSEPELQEEEEEDEEDEELLLVEVEGLRGTGQKQNDMHADRVKAMHADTPTHTHADTLQGTGRREDPSPAADKSAEPVREKAEVAVKVTEEPADEGAITEMAKEASRQKEVEMYLSVSNTLYKPNSCPILNYDTDLQGDSTEVEGEEQEGEEESEGEDTDSEGEGEEDPSSGTSEEVGTVSSEGLEADTGGAAEVLEKGTTAATLTSRCSFRDLGPEARIRRRGIRKTTERRRKEEIVEEEEDGGVGRDRRTRIFSTTDDEDNRSKSWGEVELRNVLETIGRRKRNSRFFNAAQLYQQYSEAAQNFEILRQSRSDVVSVCEDTGPFPSPAPSPPPARRPLPPIPPVPHPHSLSHTPSITSIKSLPLPEPPKSERRPSSPRLSISLTQTSTLWRELPAVRNSTELEELTEDQRRLQEVRFEVLTSEASYCRSLDIVVEHFVKSKQLAALLTTQDQNWLFSRLADVRAISHSFLSKLEERLESNIMQFTVCDIIARHCQRFKMVYVPYLTNQSYQDATYQRLMDQNPGFRRIVEKLEKSPVCQRLPLRSFLVLPFQRITRIKLLVQNIVKRTTPGTAEAMQAIKALKLLEKLIQESNDSITQMKSIESLVSLSAKVDFECRTLPLISQSRRMVREGLVTELIDFSIKDTERNVYLHLFNDYLLLSQQKEGGRFTVIDHAPVSELRAENCRFKLHSLQKNLFRLHMSKHSLLLRTETQSDKLRWISALSRPHPEIDFSCAQDFEQMQCIRAFVAQQPDELSLEKADIILVHQKSSDHWVEGTRLSDRHRGWLPASHLETISNARVRQRNLSDALKLTTATATA